VSAGWERSDSSDAKDGDVRFCVVDVVGDALAGRHDVLEQLDIRDGPAVVSGRAGLDPLEQVLAES